MKRAGRGDTAIGRAASCLLAGFNQVDRIAYTPAKAVARGMGMKVETVIPEGRAGGDWVRGADGGRMERWMWMR